MKYYLSENDIAVKPNSQPQLEFLSSPEYEILYGGAAGGGKTWSLVVDPLKFIPYSRFTAIIFRRTYPELMGSVYPLAQEYYLSAGAVWKDKLKSYVFPSGATIRLGYMQYAEDWRKYQGHEYARQYFDELTNFTEDQYLKIAPWNRSKVEGIPPKRRSASNPGGIGHLWVKKRFVDTCPPVPKGKKVYSKMAGVWWQPMKAGKTYWRKTKAPDGSIKYTSSKFIPARIFDNTDLLRNNPQYVNQLLQLPERQRRALLEGDWNAFEGQFFPFNPDEQIVKPFVIDNKFPIYGALDPGWGGYCSYSLATMMYGREYYRIATYYSEGKNIIKNVAGIKKFTKSLPLTRGRMPEFVVSDPAAWAKHDQHAIVESNKTFADYMEAAGFTLEKGLNDRLTGWANMVTFMEEKDKKGNYLYKVFDNYNKPYIEQLISAVADEKVPGDLEGRGRIPGLPYHCLDEERYRLMAIAHPEKPKYSDDPDWLQKIKEEDQILEDHTAMGE